MWLFNSDWNDGLKIDKNSKLKYHCSSNIYQCSTTC